ncbi:eCIS core domain-containing protein [Chitinimonas naiadis]
MKTHDTDTNKRQRQPIASPDEKKRARAARAVTPAQDTGRQSAVDQSPRMLAQRRAMQATFGDAFQRPADGPEIDGPAQAKSAPARLQTQNDEATGLPLQRQLMTPAPSAEASDAPVNDTGMPDQLKTGIEALSGMDMSGVRVHRNSPEPAQLNAWAYAQGNNIHLGPGQEHHLPHEAWHLVQQRQGRVRPTMQMAGVSVNDDATLEREADVMGGKATKGTAQLTADKKQALAPGPLRVSAMPVQLGRREFGYYSRDGKKKNQRVVAMEEFGDQNRIHKVDPNKIRETLPGEDLPGMQIESGDIDKKLGIWRPSKEEGTARPEDPPIYQPFRKAFHEAHNIKLALERDMKGFRKLDDQQGFTADLFKLASTVKNISISYKASVRNFKEQKEVTTLKEAYFLQLKEVTAQVEELTARMVKVSAQEDGFGAEMLPQFQAVKSRAGEQIWRDRWWAAVQEINSRLLGLWTEYERNIKEWVLKKRKEGLSYMDPEKVRSLDYIGSLAKGYKSAPKQYIRFMPEKFDVDANLDAPPLAVYAMSKGAKVDRGSVKSQGIEPLQDFEKAVNNALFGFGSKLEQQSAQGPVPGLDKDDPFEVFIRATNVSDIMFGSHEHVNAAHTEVAFGARLQTIQDQIWWLRGRNNLLSQELGMRLGEKGFVTDRGTIKEHVREGEAKDDSKRTYLDKDLTWLEMLLLGFETRATQAEKEAQRESSDSSSDEDEKPKRKKKKEPKREKKEKKIKKQAPEKKEKKQKPEKKEKKAPRKEKRKRGSLPVENSEELLRQQVPISLSSTLQGTSQSTDDL